MALELHVVPGCDPGRFARLAAGLVERAAAPGAPPRLLVAELTGDAILLGRHQRAASVRAGTTPVARRLGGGRALPAGDGVAGVLLAMHDFGVPPDRVLNRFVRGLNRGLARCVGAPVSYFGRDHVVAHRAQLAVISQEARLFEAVVGVRRPLELGPGINAHPRHGDPRIAELRATTLGELPFERLVSAIADGYASYLALPIVLAVEPPPEGAAPAVDEDEDGFTPSGLADVPIGFVEALVRRVGDRIAVARLRGDFIAPASLVRAIEARLAHAPMELEELIRRVGQGYAETPGAFIHGVVNLGIFAEAALAAARASG